jgi:predicted GTPase
MIASCLSIIFCWTAVAIALEVGATETRAIYVAGNVGVGKSFVCNVLLGGDVCLSEGSVKSITKVAQKEAFTVGTETYALIDTPGFLDGNAALDAEIVDEMRNVIKSHPICPNLSQFAVGPATRDSLEN